MEKKKTMKDLFLENIIKHINEKNKELKGVATFEIDDWDLNDETYQAQLRAFLEALEEAVLLTTPASIKIDLTWLYDATEANESNEDENEGYL